jgi:hypothetical protein
MEAALNMTTTVAQTADLAVFKTKPIGADGNFTIGWQQTLQDLIAFKTNAPKAYTLTHAQRLALFTANVTLGSLVFETDTNHVVTWNGKAWVQLV